MAMSPSVLAAAGGVVLLLGFGWLGWQNHQNLDREWDMQLAAQAEAQRVAVGEARESLKRQTQALVELVAADRRVIALIREGQAAVQAEGGGQGGPRSMAVRDQLNVLLAPYWQTLKARDARQLHAIGFGLLPDLRYLDSQLAAHHAMKRSTACGYASRRNWRRSSRRWKWLSIRACLDPQIPDNADTQGFNYFGVEGMTQRRIMQALGSVDQVEKQ